WDERAHLRTGVRDGDPGKLCRGVPFRPPGSAGDLTDPAIEPALNLVMPLAIDASWVVEELHDGCRRGFGDGSRGRLGTRVPPRHHGDPPRHGPRRIAILSPLLILPHPKIGIVAQRDLLAEVDTFGG